MKAAEIRVYGVVQGVGFRPFVRNLAVRLGLSGSVRNRGAFVEIFAEGPQDALRAFLERLETQAPPRSKIARVETAEAAARGESGFSILESGEAEAGEPDVSPDIGICPDCARELFDPENRRYLHPFINCTACGPRMTIVESLPYDRCRTSMAGFPLCSSCAAEYRDPGNRRYHAQPVCCPACGPRLYTIPETEGVPLEAARECVRSGGILAVKGIGGFHLCCDAGNEKAVRRLRSVKARPVKPFAVMARDLAAAGRECLLSDAARALLTGPERPIVLLRRAKTARSRPAVAPGNPDLGVLLPYAPVQLLLFGYPDGKPFPDCLVMTSANAPGAPVCRTDEELQEELGGKIDLALSNDRAIRLRADDSVVSLWEDGPVMIRRSRGIAPAPVLLSGRADAPPAFAAGGELKNAFCIAAGNRLTLSPYIGDLGDVRALGALDDARRKLQKMLGVEPAGAVCDPHPGYFSSRYARALGLPVLTVQHHFAHIASCLAENGEAGPSIGVAFDGTGFGPDGSMWGGEFLRASLHGFQRLGCLEPFPLFGGDSASVDGWKPLSSLLLHAGGEDALRRAGALGALTEEECSTARGAVAARLNCVLSTSAGRLFDAAAALLGVCARSTFEGQAATALEFAARGGGGSPLPLRLRDGGPFTLQTGELFLRLLREKERGIPSRALARSFHESLADGVVLGCLKCREKTGLSLVALSGGVFQNRLLLALCRARLEAKGFRVLYQKNVPANDGGLALGQAAVWAAGGWRDARNAGM